MLPKKPTLKRNIPYIPIVCTILTIITSVYMWTMKWQISLIRYFDHDELSYLFWASHMQMGNRPYIDFLLYPAPGLLWILTPIFSFFQGVMPLIIGRMMMYCIFLGLTFSLVLLFWEMRKSWIAILIGIFIIMLPLPSDKFIEIRPDTLAFFLFIFGLWLQIRVMNKPLQHRAGLILFLSGILYGLSLVVVQKILFHIIISLICFIGWITKFLIDKKLVVRQYRNLLPSFILGIIIVGIGVGIWLLRLGNLPLIWYSLVKLPFEAGKLSLQYPVSPMLFFFPNDVVYGTIGYTFGYFLNLLMWIGGLLFCIVRFMTPFSVNGKSTFWQEWMISIHCLTAFILFEWFMPMKHMQYLIPTAIFVVWYLADIMYVVWEGSRNELKKQILFLLFFIGILISCIYGYQTVNLPKLLWNNNATISEVQILYKNIPHNEYILDLECSSLYFRHPYYITCMPIGQITPLMSLSVPSLTQRLQETNTRYIFQGRYHRIEELSPADQAYIRKEYIMIGDGTLLVRNDTADRYRLSVK